MTPITWNFNQIIDQVYNLTGTTADELSSQSVANYVNTYYTFIMPFELKEQINLQPLNFNAFAYTDVYSFPAGFLTDQPMAYADGFPLIFYQDRDIFYQDWPIQYAQDAVGTGNGSTQTFTGNTQNFPIINGTWQITDGTQVCYDSGVLNSPSVPYVYALAGNGTGTINNVTGAFTVTFTTAPPASATIYDKYQGYEPARPQGVLFYNNVFTFRPIPDQMYVITLQGYINQVQLSQGSDQPLFSEWGLLLAYGAAVEIYAARGDLIAYQNTWNLLKRYENIALARFVQQMESVQSVPRF
jgi:hypothetical protein